MADLNIGDRVEIIGDIARYYRSTVGIIVGIERAVTALFNKLTIRLSDGTTGTFFPFQIQIPQAVTGRIVFANSADEQPSGLGGVAAARHLRCYAREFDLHLKILESGSTYAVLGQLLVGESAWVHAAIVTLLLEGRAAKTTTTDGMGEFKLDGIPPGDFDLEVFVPGLRILAHAQAGA